ncbi:Transmembrane protein 214-B [Eumeta japonica]|uniref:Transmembrane protein 214-B n=1 Tax=Eumeta variegata TaxID=151549 RepID=A0A4C1THE8_EUMVA|nr:Transmembrane protein 214-B [Eumeta japonica]
MSSGQWEVVGKSKKSNVANGKTKNDKKKEAALKVDNLRIEADDDRKSKKKEGDQKKQPKKQDKKSESTKTKPPKTIDEALQMIDTTELIELINMNKARFMNAPLVWLKEVATYLNTKIPIDVNDPTFSNQISYPLSAAPKELKDTLQKVLQDAGKSNCQLFFEVTLTALANDMSKGQTVNGHRLLLQLLAQEYPEFCIVSIPKYINLRNSYQNRPPIGLSLLWAFGQGGFKDFQNGLQTWQELFLPIIDLKNYTKYIVDYLSKIQEVHMARGTANISQEQFLGMCDMVANKRGNQSKLPSDLMKQLIVFKDIYFKSNTNKFQVTFNQLMKKLPNQYIPNQKLDEYTTLLLMSLVECLQRDDSCNATWRQLFNRCSKQSAMLIQYIDSNWDQVNNRLKKKSLKATVLQYKEICGDTLKGKKKDETVEKANKACQEILDRMTSTRRFPWLWASFGLLLGIAGLLAYDVSRVGGNFPKSATGRLLNDLGVLEQSQWAWQKTLSASARGYLWVEDNAPVYYTQVSEFSKPYVELTRDVFKVVSARLCELYGNMKDYAIDKAPLVRSTIEEYVPGLADTVQGYATTSWSVVKKHSLEYYNITMRYLTTKVFVGDWAPEILQNRTQTALNVTKQQLGAYLLWLREQAHVYSKIP